MPLQLLTNIGLNVCFLSQTHPQTCLQQFLSKHNKLGHWEKNYTVGGQLWFLAKFPIGWHI